MNHDDREIYEHVFQPCKVPEPIFEHLMSRGKNFKVGRGGVVVSGGQPLHSVIMVLRGEAEAFELMTSFSRPDAGTTPICRYRGRLDDSPDEGSVPLRGSLIGGSAIVDRNLSSAYPNRVVAIKPMEYVAWDIDDLRRVLDESSDGSLQAAFYRALYVELIGTLHRDRALQIQQQENEEHTSAPPPRARQLVQLFIFMSIPFFGFGFADNFIMIICGDSIDAHFGARLGLTTMAAAGLGNWVSDCVGLGLGDFIESIVARLGLSDGKLTLAQQKLRITKLVSLFSKLLGISLGCFAGMVPLLFLTPHKLEFNSEDLNIYDTVFRPNGVSTHQFADLMALANKKRTDKDDLIMESGVHNAKVTLLLTGQAAAYTASKTTQAGQGKAVWRYVGKLETEQPVDDRKAPVRGSIIGGSAIVDRQLLKQTFPNDVVATTPVEYLQWDLDALCELMSEEKAIQASMYGMLYGELLRNVGKDKHNQQFDNYLVLLEAVVADGIVDSKEKTFIEAYQEKWSISEEDHLYALREVGWTKQGWEAGSMGGTLRSFVQRSRSSRAPGTETLQRELVASITNLEEALPLFEEAVKNMRNLRDEIQ